MLDAAACGEVFTSPVPDQITAATNGVDGGAGVLHIVKNYTGDVMNFEMAAEMAGATGGAEVVAVVTDDDVAVQDSLYTVGRRGVGVTVLVEKIAGAAAEAGRSLSDVAAVARRVNAAGRSMGLALTSCTVPAAGKPTSICRTTRSRSASGSMGSPAGHACRSRPRPRWPGCSSIRSWTTSSSPATASLPSSTAWAARR
jgi:dihydroxyacetone kinase-like protein